MKIYKTVPIATAFILLGQIILCSLFLIGFYLFSALSKTVFIGALIGSSLAVINFFLVGVTVQHSMNAPENKKAKIHRISVTLRMIFVAVIVLCCLIIPKLDTVATVVPLIFPRLTIFINGLFSKK